MKKDLFSTYRSLATELKPYTWPIIGSLAVTSLVIGADLLQPYLFKSLIDTAIGTLSYHLLIPILLLLLLLIVIRSLASYADTYVRAKVGEHITAMYRKKLFDHILHLPLATIHNNDCGVFVSRIMNECGKIGRVYVTNYLLPILASGIQALALIILLFLLSWQVCLVSILVFPTSIFVTQKIAQRSRQQDRKFIALVEKGQSFLQEILSGIREVRAVGNETYEIGRWSSWIHDYSIIGAQTSAEHEFMRTSLNKLINWIGICIVYGFGAWQIVNHQITVGTLLATSLYVQQLYTIFALFLSIRIETSKAANSLQSLQEIFAFPREWPQEGQALSQKIEGNLEFVDVSFRYPSSEGQVKHISFCTSPGKILGIVGPSGGGKSTLIDLCMRFYTPDQGVILLDGHDLSQLSTHEVRKYIGIVSQDIMLWDTTIKENLLYGLPYEVTWEQIIDICRKTQVHAFVQTLPLQYETIVGSRGVKLSGGEKQRIALARVLLRDPVIILLDEATAALDSLTEAEITNTLLQTFQQKNRIVVAHRLATVQSADYIIVIDQGEIVEHGTPKELYQQNGLFTRLYETQNIQIQGC